jgi:hypothetical protein
MTEVADALMNQTPSRFWGHSHGKAATAEIEAFVIAGAMTKAGRLLPKHRFY